MGIAKTHRRKLKIAERLFIWYVKQDYDSADFVLHVSSEDKRFIVNYRLGQRDETRFLIVLGREFPGLPEAHKRRIRVLCPKWEDQGVIGPGDVRRLIEWANDSGKTITRVDWRGTVLNSVD